MNTAEAYEKVTARIIAQLEAGTVPWAKPWQAGGAPLAMPVSVHGHKYRGINLLILLSAGFTSPAWLTYNQAKKLGGNVRKGEKGTAVLLWKRGRTYTIEGAKGGEPEERRGYYATTFTVFNAEQCEGLPANVAPPVETVPASEIVAEYLSDGGPKLRMGGDRACYSPLSDLVSMPAATSFKSHHAFEATLFHELVHSTGHASRLGREIQNVFGDHKYSKEELVAELGAAFLCARAGIQSPELEANSAAYIKSWLSAFQGDPKMLVQAASAAQKAVDHILNEELQAVVQGEAVSTESEAA
jgi:antirestriction protein ArdC